MGPADSVLLSPNDPGWSLEVSASAFRTAWLPSSAFKATPMRSICFAGSPAPGRWRPRSSPRERKAARPFGPSVWTATSWQSGPGEAVVFVRRGTEWFQEAALEAAAGHSSLYGRAVALSDGRALVADPAKVYAFTMDGASWSLSGEFEPAVALGKIDLWKRTALIGAPDEAHVIEDVDALQGGAR